MLHRKRSEHALKERVILLAVYFHIIGLKVASFNE